MDGSAHVYNATILKNILFDDGWFSSFYEINKEFVPNWFGHFVLVAFKTIFSGEMADKLFLLSYGVLFPFSFRYLIKQVAPKNIQVSYLILPFMYTFVFTMGFYNFCFSLVFLFFVLGYFIKYHNSLTTKRKFLLSLLFLLCYFSHLFSFITSVLVLSFFLVFSLKKDGLSIKENITLLLNHSFVLFYCSAVPLFLTSLYFYKRKDLPKNEIFVSSFDLTKELYDFRALFSYTTESEILYNRIYLVIFFIFFIFTCFVALKNIFLKRKSLECYFLMPSNIWILLILIFVVLYYKMPDSDGSAGYISVRLAIMIYIYIIILFAITAINKNITSGLVFVFLTAHFNHLWFKNSIQIQLNESPIELSIIEKNIPEHSVVYPVNMSGNWIAGHFSNYLAAEKPILVLDNYEASNNYFPVKWKEKPEFKWMVGSVDLYNMLAPQTRKVDYILVHGVIANFQSTKNDFTYNVFSDYKVCLVFKNFILFKNRTTQ
jgi:hypothetical protein